MVGTLGRTNVGIRVDFPDHRLVFCLFFIVLMVRALSGGGRFTCVGGHANESNETSALRREVRELREELNRLKSAR